METTREEDGAETAWLWPASLDRTGIFVDMTWGLMDANEVRLVKCWCVKSKYTQKKKKKYELKKVLQELATTECY